MERSPVSRFFHVRNPERIDGAGLPACRHGVDRQDFIGPREKMQGIQDRGPISAQMYPYAIPPTVTLYEAAAQSETMRFPYGEP